MRHFNMTDLCVPEQDYMVEFCEGKKIVLMIDEVDRSSDYHTFINFLGMLRDKYLRQKAGRDFSFHSVILAGVHDIKNIKSKMIQQGTYTSQPKEGASYNSPWNIAANYEVDMSFNLDDIASMLTEYAD